jgi:hypothetical protein
MSKIYIMFVDAQPGSVDWITYCRAAMLYHALPNCAGVFKLSSPPASLRTETDGWNLYLLAHGDDTAIGGLKGADLAAKLTGIIPATATGFIHVQSCKTGATPAKDFAEGLGKKGHKLFVKAPADNATFTEEVGFRVLDRGEWDKNPDNAKKYRELVNKYVTAGGQAAAKVPSSGDLLKGCDAVYSATQAFWPEFSKLFKNVSFPTGQGWKAYETIPGTGAKAI